LQKFCDSFGMYALVMQTYMVQQDYFNELMVATHVGFQITSLS